MNISSCDVIEERNLRLHDFIASASFWMPEALVPSAWIEHAPFAFWLIDVHRPRVLVELGTHHGYSYLAFDQAVKSLGLETRSFAVDTWKGDEHSGFYGEEVFEELRAYHDSQYSEFSQLVCSTFEDALANFQDESIDLLHIDGRHFYSDVKRDFEDWKPKLSDRAVVLFHDTNFRGDGFGVVQLWDELRSQYPCFEFIHGHGLGIIGVGNDLPPRISALFESSKNPALCTQVREVYSRLGSAITDRYMVAECRRENALQRTELDHVRSELARLRTELGQSIAHHQQLTSGLAQMTVQHESLHDELTLTTAALNEIRSSFSWRVTSPIRAVGRKALSLKAYLHMPTHSRP